MCLRQLGESGIENLREEARVGSDKEPHEGLHMD